MRRPVLVAVGLVVVIAYGLAVIGLLAGRGAGWW